MRKLLIIGALFATLLAFSNLLGCSDGGYKSDARRISGDADGDGDSDNDGDMDGDTDSEVNSDADGDAKDHPANDADDDLDTDIDGQMGGDADGDSDTDINSDADGDAKDDFESLEGECTVHGEVCACIEQTADLKRVPVDLIFAVDSTGSIGMTVARDKIQNGVNDLTERIFKAGVNSHVVLLAGTGDGGAMATAVTVAYCIPPPLGSGQCGGGTQGNAAGTTLGGPGRDSKEPEFLHLNVFFGFALSAQQRAAVTLLNQYPAYKKVLREKAHKQFVIVEDYHTNLTPEMFQKRLNNLDPPIKEGSWTFNAVHVRTENPNNDNYTKLVEATGGYEGQLGQPEVAFDELLQIVGTNVIEGTPLACEWDIPAPPKGTDFDKNLVNVKFTPSKGKPIEFKKVTSEKKCADNQGWFYDDENNPKKVLVCPTACEEIQKDNAGRINIILGCQTVVVVK